jgi:hypothetical protein
MTAPTFPLKTYFTRLLGDRAYTDFHAAKQYSQDIRKQFLGNPDPWTECILDISSDTRHRTNLMKKILMAPLFYKFTKEMEISGEVFQHSRNLVFLVLSKTTSGLHDSREWNIVSSQEDQAVVQNFENSVSQFLEDDRKQSALPLYSHYHDVREMLEIYPEDPSLLKLKETIEKTARIMNLEEGLSLFMREMETMKQTVLTEKVTEMMNTAYFDMLKEQLEKKDYGLFLMCIEEIRGLIHQKFPNLSSDFLDELLDVDFLQYQLQHEGYDLERVKNAFDSIEQNLFPSSQLNNNFGKDDTKQSMASYVCLRLEYLYQSISDF